MNKRIWFVITLILSLVVSSTAWATNGYFTAGTGTKNKGMAGAGLALPEDAIAIANNPAAAFGAAGKSEVGLSFFSPSRNYSTSASQANGQGGAFTVGPNDIDSSKDLFFIPHLARSWRSSENTAFAMAFYGRGGMNTEWKGGSATFDPDGPGPAPVMTLPGTFGGGTAGVDLSQAFLDIAWSQKLNETVIWGASLIVAIQLFEAYGVGNFAGFTETFASSGGTKFPTALSDNGKEFSYGLGAKLGAQFELNERASFALSYQSKIRMTDLDDYADLFADGGGFDIPANFKAGITFKPNSGLALSFDIEHTWFSDIGSVGNPISNLFACPTAGAGGSDLTSCLGGKNGTGFGWDDMTVFKVGAQWNNGGAWTWRAGYSHGDQPIPSSQVLFNILAPAVIEDHIALGFTRKSASNRELSVALTHALKNDVSGPNPFDPTQTINIEMQQWELEFSYGWKF